MQIELKHPVQPWGQIMSTMLLLAHPDLKTQRHLSLINDTWKFGKILGQFHCSIIEVFQFAQLFPLVIFNLSSERKSDWIERTIKTQIPCLWDLLAAFLILCLSIAALTSENRLWANCSWVGGAKSTEFWGDFCNQKRRVSQGSLYKWTEHFIKSNSFR